ncbi:MAG TPA: thioredoxin family protein [Caulobacteraceae bacterium]|jgi:thiol-disulfide isomerase/thioredoxin|nr:thioredoxin family protein [Caulobacteraceae bacterium]
MRRALLAGLVLALSAAGALAAPAPKVSIASLAELATPLPSPYDPAADARAEVAAAASRARAAHKLLLIDLGGNWCGDCRVLAGIMRLPEVAAFVAAHYVVVVVDVGHMNRNLDIPARYGVSKLDGVPSLLVVDAHGRLKDAGHVAALADARHMTPQGLADWLASWTN